MLYWRANYDDGTSLYEIDNSGKESKIKDIVFSKLVSFDLVEPSDKVEDFVEEELETISKTVRDKKVVIKCLILQDDVKPKFRVILGGLRRLIFVRRERQTAKNQRLVILNGEVKEDWERRKDKNLTKDERDNLRGLEEMIVPFSSKKEESMTILGWQETINGVNRQAIMYIYSDGRVEISGEWGKDVNTQRPTSLDNFYNDKNT